MPKYLLKVNYTLDGLRGLAKDGGTKRRAAATKLAEKMPISALIGLPVMASTKHQGVTGLIEFDAKGDVKNSALTLYTFRNKKREQLAVVR